MKGPDLRSTPLGATINERQARATFRSAFEKQVGPEGVHAFAKAEAVQRELSRVSVCQHFDLFIAPVGNRVLGLGREFLELGKARAFKRRRLSLGRQPPRLPVRAQAALAVNRARPQVPLAS